MEIIANQEPFALSLDENKRNVFVMNFRARSVGLVNTWEEDLMTLITNAGLGTSGTDSFIGPAVILPDGDGPLTQIIATSGTTPTEAQNADVIDERLSAQITVRGKAFQTTRERARLIWRAIHGKRNVTI
jgi:hypothetical protein